MSPRAQQRRAHLLPGVRLLPAPPPNVAREEKVPPWYLDPQKAFSFAPKECWLEIGFGDGGTLAHLARHHRDIGMLGCETYRHGIDKMLRHIENDGLTNVRLHDEDARPLLACLKPSSLARVYLLYPDPWPKTRHAKRRFINEVTLNLLWRVLAPNGLFTVATDMTYYAWWTFLHVRRHQGFTCHGETPHHWRVPPKQWYATRYERKALNQGRSPLYLCFQKKA